MTELEIATYILRGSVTIFLGIICYFVKNFKSQFENVKMSLADLSIRLSKIETQADNTKSGLKSLDEHVSMLQGLVISEKVKEKLSESDIDLNSLKNNGKTIHKVIQAVITSFLLKKGKK